MSSRRKAKSAKTDEQEAIAREDDDYETQELEADEDDDDDDEDDDDDDDDGDDNDDGDDDTDDARGTMLSDPRLPAEFQTVGEHFYDQVCAHTHPPR